MPLVSKRNPAYQQKRGIRIINNQKEQLAKNNNVFAARLDNTGEAIERV